MDLCGRISLLQRGLVVGSPREGVFGKEQARGSADLSVFGILSSDHGAPEATEGDGIELQVRGTPVLLDLELECEPVGSGVPTGAS